MFSPLRQILDTALHRLPLACVLCGDGAGADALCDGCRQDLPRLPSCHCPVCAVPTTTPDVCGRCLRDRPAYDKVIAACQYAFPMDALIRRLKFHGALPLAHTLGRALWTATQSRPRPDLLLPVPLAAARLRQRGFNQAAEIARALARAGGLRLHLDLCERIRDTPEQSGLSLAARGDNLRAAFRCGGRMGGAAVVVVDDVMTSGATLNALAHTLKTAGARRVEAWVVARTGARTGARGGTLSAGPSTVAEK